MLPSSTTMPGFKIQQNNWLSGGFTLLEVMVALSVVAIVLVAALRLQGQSVTMSETARFYTIAPFMAQEKIAEIRFDPQPFMGGASGDFRERYPDYEWSVILEEGIATGSENADPSLLSVAVVIESPTIKKRYVLRDSIHSIAGEF